MSLIFLTSVAVSVPSPKGGSSAIDLDQIVSGSSVPPPAAKRADSKLFLVDWNIERGVRGPEILQSFRGPLAADVYILQEVDLNTRRTGFRNVAEDLAHGLNMNYVLGIEFEELAQRRSGKPAYQGQALISRLPILRSRVLRFRRQLHDWGARWKPNWSATVQPRKGGRMALVAEIELGGRALVIYNTHLESRADDHGRALQVQEILEDMEKHYPADTPVIVAGDLNTERGTASPVVTALKAAGFEDVLQNAKGHVRTKVGSRGRKDWILTRHVSSSDAQVPEITLSDHYPLTVRIATSDRVRH